MKVTLAVTRTDEYEIDIDKQVWNHQALTDWSPTFWSTEDVYDLGKALATALMQYGLGTFMEGFGYVEQLRPDGSEIAQFKIFKGSKIVLPVLLRLFIQQMKTITLKKIIRMIHSIYNF